MKDRLSKNVKVYSSNELYRTSVKFEHTVRSCSHWSLCWMFEVAIQKLIDMFKKKE